MANKMTHEQLQAYYEHATGYTHGGIAVGFDDDTDEDRYNIARGLYLGGSTDRMVRHPYNFTGTDDVKTGA